MKGKQKIEKKSERIKENWEIIKEKQRKLKKIEK